MDNQLLFNWRKVNYSTIKKLEEDILEIQNTLKQNVPAELAYMKSMLEGSLSLLIDKKNDYIYMAKKIEQNPNSEWSISMMQRAIDNAH
jgi:hypothetical protein